MKASGYPILVGGWLFGSITAASAQGLAPEDPVFYRGLSATPHYRAFLPADVDLSADFPVPANQGEQGSCTAWAVGYALRSFEDIKSGHAERRQASQAFSPAYIYNQIKAEPGNCLEPTRITDALKFIEDHGAVPMAAFPYQDSDCTRMPPPDLEAVAAQHRLITWRRVNFRQIDDVKGQLAQRHPVVFGARIPLSFEHLKPGQVLNQVAGPKDYAHAMVAVGYSDRLQAIKVINSWGTEWGEGGFGWIGYDAFSRNALSAFVAEAKVAAPPAPAPPPPPVLVSVPEPEPVPVPVPEVPSPPAPPVQVSTEPPQEVTPPPQVVVHEPVRPLPAPPPPSLEDTLKGYQCASLAGHAGSGGLRVEGFVASDADLARLDQAVAALPDGAGRHLAVAVRPWPQCEALGTLAAPLAKADGLTVDLSTRSGSPHFAAGDHLVITVRTPGYPSFVDVTYIQANGDAVHLVRSGSKPMAASSTVVLGQDRHQPSFLIGPPFGRELVVVVASRQPLFNASLPRSEEERSYLTRLREAVLSAGTARIAAAAAAAITQSGP